MEMTAVNAHAMKSWIISSILSAVGAMQCAGTQGGRGAISRPLTMRPSGLFAGARPIASIADHSWRNAKRIAELTGQSTPSDITTTFSAESAGHLRFDFRNARDRGVG